MAPLNQVPGAVVSLMDRTNVETVIVAGKMRKWKGQLLDVNLDTAAQASSRPRATLSSRRRYSAGLVQQPVRVYGIKRKGAAPAAPFCLWRLEPTAFALFSKTDL